jgi:hypothetical protein
VSDALRSIFTNRGAESAGVGQFTAGNTAVHAARHYPRADAFPAEVMI